MDPSAERMVGMGARKITTRFSTYFVLPRPGLDLFFKELVSCNCSVYLYTHCEDTEFVKAVLQIIDPYDKVFRHRVKVPLLSSHPPRPPYPHLLSFGSPQMTRK